MRFFDASAVVKRYVDEAGSAQVRQLLASAEALVSRLSEVEVASSVDRRMREGGLSREERAAALDALRKDLAVWKVVEVTPEVTSMAMRLLRIRPLRASDAIQLASALVVRDNLPDLLQEFVAFDRRLVDAALGEGLTVVKS